MQISIWASILYFISFLGVASGIFMYRKSSAGFDAATWLPISAISVMGFQTLAAAILNLIHVTVNAVTVGICNLLLAAVVWFFIFKQKRWQQYSISLIDGIVWLILVVLIIKIALMRYGAELCVHYNSIDGAAHMISALDVVNTGNISTMFFAALHNALLIELLGPFFTVATYYKIYVLGDILLLLLSGIMFWGLIRRYCNDRFLKIAGIFATILYMLGYPLNSMQFGFSYMGMCVTVIACLIAILDSYVSDEVDNVPAVVLISFGCISVFQSYVLFMPVVYFAVLVCILINQHKKGILISANTIAIGCGIFLIPTAIGLWFTYRGIFGHSGSGGQTVGSAITVEGGIYRDLFSNFVLLVPFALFGVWNLIKKKKNRLAMILLPMEVVFIVALFFMTLQGKASAYYYFKNYYVLWLIVFYLAFEGIVYLEAKTRPLLVCGFIVWCCIAGSILINLDNYITERAPLLYERTGFEAFADIYDFNLKFLRTPRYDDGALKLYRYAREELLDEELVTEIPVLADWEDRYWMQAVTNQRIGDMSADSIKKLINEGTYSYVIVLTGSQEYADNVNYFDSLERVFENASGFIAKSESD